MTTPTLSMQMFGAEQRKIGLARERREAAKKAWRTRRYRAKPSSLMRKILAFLTSRPDARISLHYHGMAMYYIGLCCINEDGSHTSAPYNLPRVNRKTHRAMEKRGWFELVRRRDTGGTVEGGKITVPSYDLDYKITAKGIKALSVEQKEKR